MILLQRLQAANFKQIESIDIRFPEVGTMLIEGRNEAGKSTLFEAIFFALYGKLPDGADPKEARRYGTETLDVTLDFTIEGRAFCVSRRQGSRQTASLMFSGTTGESERTSGLTAVNQQIVQEMHLSAQGLLNTCFVEQKKLEHLESLDPAKREAAINELVNLSALTKMEKSLTPLSEDRKSVEASKQRLQIAILDTQHANLTAEITRLHPLQSAARLAEIHAAQTEVRNEIETRETQQASLARAISLKETRSWLNDTLQPRLTVWKTAAEAVDLAELAVAKAEAARESLPGLQESVARLSTLQDARTHWQNLRDEDANRARWESEQEAAQLVVRRLTRAAEDAEQRLTDARNALTAAETFHALHEWARATRELETAVHPPFDAELARLSAAVKNAEAARDEAKAEAMRADATARHAEIEAQKLAARCQTEITALQDAYEQDISAPLAAPPAPPSAGGTGVGIGLVSAGVLLGILSLVLRLPLLLFPAALLLVLGAGSIALSGKARQNAVVRLREQEAERQRQASLAREQKRESLRAAVALLQAESDRGKEAAQAVRATAGQQERDHGAAEITVSRAESELATRRVGTDRSGQVPGLRDAVTRATEPLRTLGISALPAAPEEAELLAGEAPLLSPAELRKTLTTSQEERDTAIARRNDAEKAVAPYAVRHALTPDERAVALSAPKLLEGAGFGLDAPVLTGAVRQAERERDTAADLGETLADRQNERRSATSKAQEAKAAFFECLNRQEMVSALSPKLSLNDRESAPEEAEERTAHLRESLSLREAGEDAALTAQTLEDLRHEDTRLGGEIIVLREKQESLHHDEIEPRAALGLPKVGDARLSELLPELLRCFPDSAETGAAQWQEQILACETNAQDNRISRRTLAEASQIADAALDETVERDAWEAAKLALDINNQARKILDKTRSVILERILPGTQLMVKRILPLLTDNRYREIKWDTQNNLVEVQDERKGGLAAKKVFSGGTRDQISLALRLSFVLATLPGGRATRPGWLFLDEPLSSFDAERSESLIKLLTQGSLIRPRFPQIFLISHSAAADPSRFDYHLVLEGGKISPQSRLPIPVL